MEQKLFTVEYKRTQRGHFWPITANVMSEHFNIETTPIKAGDFGLMKERAKESINTALEQAGYSYRVKEKEIEYSPKF